MSIVKKYSNRRLYDTESSRYITLDELAAKVRDGDDVQVVDAKSGEDLTQATLTQLILEGPAAKLLPVPLLRRLLRMQDDALAEFFSKYVTWALDLYLSARNGAQQIAPYFPFGSLPMQATDAMLRLFGRAAPTPDPPPPPPRRDAYDDDDPSEIAKLRAELELIKQEMRKPR